MWEKICGFDVLSWIVFNLSFKNLENLLNHLKVMVERRFEYKKYRACKFRVVLLQKTAQISEHSGISLHISKKLFLAICHYVQKDINNGDLRYSI